MCGSVQKPITKCDGYFIYVWSCYVIRCWVALGLEIKHANKFEFMFIKFNRFPQLAGDVRAEVLENFMLTYLQSTQANLNSFKILETMADFHAS